MLCSVSATQLVKYRPALGQRIVPARGSVLASPVPGDYDPDPDYFFHWLRDAGIVMDALTATGDPGRAQRFRDFVAFSRGLGALDGRQAGLPANIPAEAPPHRRPAEDLEALHGEALLGEPRFNPDGTPDILAWGRPQYDGAALCALALMRHSPNAADADPALTSLVFQYLDFTAAHWDREGFDPWEERRGRHYYTHAVQLGALERGTAWAGAAGAPSRAAVYEAQAAHLLGALDGFWSEQAGAYCRSLGPDGANGELDSAIILGVLHAGRGAGPHSPRDPRVHATVARLETLFARLYRINADRAADEAPALGRNAADVYYGGNPWYLTTLAGAELQYRFSASRAGSNPAEAAAAFRKGDDVLRIVRRYTPASGELSEQFDRDAGAPKSARRLAWSYAAFLTAHAARRRAEAAIAGA